MSEELSSGGLIALGSVIGGVLTAIAGGAVTILNVIHKNRQEAKKAENVSLQEVLNILQQENKQLKSQMSYQQAAIEEVAEDHSRCQVDMADLYGNHKLLHAWAIHAAEQIEALGGKRLDVPALAAAPRRDSGKSEFIRRSTRHATDLINADSDSSAGVRNASIKAPDSTGGG